LIHLLAANQPAFPSVLPRRKCGYFTCAADLHSRTDRRELKTPTSSTSRITFGLLMSLSPGPSQFCQTSFVMFCVRIFCNYTTRRYNPLKPYQTVGNASVAVFKAAHPIRLNTARYLSKLRFSAHFQNEILETSFRCEYSISSSSL